MAFALKKTSTVTRPVPLTQYDENGVESTSRLNVRFKIIPRAQLDDMIRGESEGETVVTFDQVVDGIADTVTNESGEPMSAADALALIREDMILSGQITSYYFQFIAGTIAAKNAQRSRAR